MKSIGSVEDERAEIAIPIFSFSRSIADDVCWSARLSILGAQGESSKLMSKVYQVTAAAADATLETIVELPDGISLPESRLEGQAKAFAKQAILKRWRELYPNGPADLDLDLSVQFLPGDGLENRGLGPYRLGLRVQVWITNAPNSWGWGGPRPRY
jgi:hypothetical protein